MERNIFKIGKELFITSDEEIKEGDWVYNLKYSNIRKRFLSVNGINSIQKEDRKIILTTDPDLIKEGVQAIDDAYSEGFENGKNYQAEKMYSEEELKFIEKAITTHWEMWNSAHPDNVKDYDLSKNILQKLKL